MPKLKILIAEDDKSTQILYHKKLPDALFDKQIFADGVKALEAYTSWEPDIVLLDLNMPIMNGHQVLKTIREEKDDMTTTVIIVTSSSEKEEIVACAKLGIQGYIVKPFHGNELPLKLMEYHKNK